MAAWDQELPENVDVETITFVAFSDGRPTEVIAAGTVDDNVRHGHLTVLGTAYFQQLADVLLVGGLQWDKADVAG